MPIAEAEMLLPIEQRIVLSLRYEHDWPVENIAERLGMTQGEVRLTGRRAVAAVVPLLVGGTPKAKVC